MNEPLDINAWTEAFKIVADTDKVEVHVLDDDDAPDFVQKERDGSWKIGINPNGDRRHAVHEACHQIFSQWRLTKEAQAWLANPNVKYLYKAIEDARIDMLGSAWFHQDLTGFHKEELAKTKEMAEIADKHIAGAVTSYLYDLGYGTTDKPIQETLDYFKDELALATVSPDPQASLELAIKMAEYLQWRQAELPPGEPEESDLEGDGEGEGEGDGEGEGSEGDTGEDESEGAGKDSDTGGKDSGAPPPPRSSTPPKPKPKPLPKPLERKLEKSLSKIKPPPEKKRALSTGATYDTGRLERPMAPIDYGKSDDKTDFERYPHTVAYKTLRQEQIVLDERTKIFMHSQDDVYGQVLKRTGQPSHKAWQLAHGNTKVFTHPPKKRGKLVCLVDLSGSMGCWCQKCKSARSEIHGRHVQNGYVAFQVVGALSTQHPDIEVFGFCHDDSENYITPFQPGMQPICRRSGEVPSENPDCAALMWLERYVSGQDTTAIIISDGQPVYPAGGCSRPSDHLKKVASRMANSGTKFASVLINTPNDSLYPAVISANVNTIYEIDNLQPILDSLED